MYYYSYFEIECIDSLHKDTENHYYKDGFPFYRLKKYIKDFFEEDGKDFELINVYHNDRSVVVFFILDALLDDEEIKYYYTWEGGHNQPEIKSPIAVEFTKFVYESSLYDFNEYYYHYDSDSFSFDFNFINLKTDCAERDINAFYSSFAKKLLNEL
jgi:hypothetical protein